MPARPSATATGEPEAGEASRAYLPEPADLGKDAPGAIERP